VWAWAERQRYILDYTLSSLARRTGKNLSLLGVYALVVFSLASVLLFTHALRREAALLLEGAPVVVVQRMAAGRHEMIPERALADLGAIRGVRRAQGRLWGYWFDAGARANYTLMVPDRFWGEPGEVVIGPGVVRARRAGPGDAFILLAYDGTLVQLRVREVVPVASELVASDLVLLSAADFRRVFGVPEGVFTDVALTVPNAAEVATVAAKVRQRHPDTRPITRAEIARTYESIFDWRSGLVVIVLSATALAFAIVAWDKASGLSAEERREIGILKAIGWETSDVLWARFWEGAVVSLAAFAVGLLGAYLHVFFTPVALFAPVLKGWSVLYPEFRLVPRVSPYLVATLFFLTVVPYTVATVVPSWRAATTDPDAVMRS